MFLHEKFIALFSTPLQAINAAKIKGYLTFSGYFYPHDLQKTPNVKEPSNEEILGYLEEIKPQKKESKPVTNNVRRE